MANEYYSNASAGERFLAGEVASGSAVDAKYDSIEAGFDKLPTPVQLSQGTANYAADTGAANAYVIALPKVPTSYTAGMQVRFLAANASTGASTINVNALGVKSLRRQDGTPIVAGDIPAGMPVTATYNGTNFRLDTSTAVMVDEAEAARDASQAAQASAETAYGQAYAARTDAILAKADALGSASDSANSATAALASQNAAASSETAAAGSASAAAGSASTASTQATNAATSASDSQVSATASAASAAAAAGSEAGVAADAAAALAHKNAAATSETNAAASETAAAASETAAAASQTAASGSASAAANSASNASTSAGTATTQAGTATTQAGIATTQASNAAGSASAAATSAANAATSETNAATSAATATGAQAAAEAARDSALTAFDNFDDRYLGTKAADPTLDNDGNALVAGALYFDSTTEAMKVYTGSAWVAAYVSGEGVAQLSGAAFTGDVTAPNLNIAAWDAIVPAPVGTDTQTVRYNGTTLEATSVLTVDGSGNVAADGTITASGGNSSQWNTAYGWGNHGTEGYLTASSVADSSLGLFTTKTAAEVGYTGASASGNFAHLRGGTHVAGLTYEQAMAGAASLGVRLPTIEELEDEVAKGTGGGFDSQICWTCSAVPNRSGYVYAKLGTGAGARYEYPTDGTQTAATRYVANVDKPAIDAATLGGAVASSSASNGTIVQRHPSGYIFANYFNTTPNDVSSGITKVCVESGNDGFIRHGTVAGISAFMDTASGGTSATQGRNGNTAYRYNVGSHTPTRGDCSLHVFQVWATSPTYTMTSATFLQGDIARFSVVRDGYTVTVTGARIYLPNGSYNTSVTWTGTGGFTLAKYTSTSGYWMVLP